MFKPLLCFIIGGFLYGFLEIIYRGFTHWTMLIAGGFCFSIFAYINSIIISDSLLIRCVFSCSIITLVELLFGYVFNLKLKWNIWDYSNDVLNLYGQICLKASLIWFIMGIPMTYLLNLIEKFV